MEAEVYGYRCLCLPLRKRFRDLSVFVRKHVTGRIKKRAPLGCCQLQLAAHSGHPQFVNCNRPIHDHPIAEAFFGILLFTPFLFVAFDPRCFLEVLVILNKLRVATLNLILLSWSATKKGFERVQFSVLSIHTGADLFS
jgi:hypothetical protein